MDPREFFKRWPNFYFAIALVFGPVFFTGLSDKKFLTKYPRTGRTLNIGSGPRVLGKEVENVDPTAYAGVAIIASAEHVPLSDGSVARIVSNNVLEHVREPQKAVQEMHRLLEPGGVAYVATPFMYPFHSSPSDYQRWTAEGLKELFKNFEIVEIGNRAGPFSALTTYLVHFVGFLFSFGSMTLYSLFTNIAMFLLFPLKLPDLIFNYWPNAHLVAAVLYCVVRKK